MSETTPSSSSPLPPVSASQTPPSAFIIGKSFLKQYYAVLATNPENIPRFYKPDTSIISHSFQPSVPAEPKVLTSESTTTNSPKDFFKWACSTSSTDGSGPDGSFSSEGENGKGSSTAAAPPATTGGISVDFGSGAIDAQETIGGGILLVVTGQMTLPSSTPKPFVHTFFLSNSAPAGKKKNFYVHNDILRFISTPDDQVLDQQQQQLLQPSPPQQQQEMSASEKQPQQKGTKETPVPQDKPTQQEGIEVEVTATPAPEPSVAPQPQTQKVKIVEGKGVEKAEKDGKDGKRKDEADKSTSSNNNKSAKKDDSKTEKSKQKTKLESAVAEKSNDSSSKGNKKKDKDNATATVSSSEGKTNKSDGQNKKKNANNDAGSSEQQQTTKDEKKSKKNKARSRSRKKGRSGSRSASPTHGKNGKSGGGKNDDDSSSVKPGSWASVVGGSGSTASKPPAAATESAVADDVSVKEGDKTTKSNQPMSQGASPPTNNESNNTNSSSNKEAKLPSSSKSNSNGPPPPVPQRTPEATLFLKNVSDRTKETEIRAMFEPYATKLGQKILGITLKASSGFCFVDFDAKIVVDTILKEADGMKSNGKQQDSGAGGGNEKKSEANKFVIHGKLLDVGRKVPVEKSGGRRHTFRSSSPGNSAYPKSRHHRRNSPRGGNRSGRQHGHQDKK